MLADIGAEKNIDKPILIKITNANATTIIEVFVSNNIQRGCFRKGVFESNACRRRWHCLK